MGIDKSNVRYVFHAGMPKSLENYQQESGRAGRDGLEAECLLLYSGVDYVTWKSILQDTTEQARDIALTKLGHMYGFCTGTTCRHKAVTGYFGQSGAPGSCGACDVCLGEIEGIPDALTVAQKILSSVLRQGERFGAEYTAGVLTGSREDRILANHHDQLSTYGLLAENSKAEVRDWIEQLAEQEFVERVGEYGVLRVTEKGRRVLKGIELPLLVESRRKKKAAPRPAPVEDSWQDVDRGLFETLRTLRRKLAQQRGMPAYIVFGDSALRDMARKRPSTPATFLQVSGVGDKKLEQYGSAMMEAIQNYCKSHSLEMNVFPPRIYSKRQ
jgi:ATP-dependent DNA helicase RecQ